MRWRNWRDWGVLICVGVVGSVMVMLHVNIFISFLIHCISYPYLLESVACVLGSCILIALAPVIRDELRERKINS